MTQEIADFNAMEDSKNLSETESINMPLGLIRDWSDAQDFQSALDVMALWLPKLIQNDRASVTISTQDATGFEVFKLKGSTALPTGTILPLDSIPGDAVKKRSVLNVPSLEDSAYQLEAPLLVQHGLRSCLSAPLVSGGECYGSLNIARRELDAFDQSDETLVKGLAEVLGATLFALRRFETEREFAITDSLTGVANRRHIMDLIGQRLHQGTCTAPLLFLDLDGFKLINDAYGHHTGDQMLREVSRRLVNECEPDHLVGRIGGDEFLILCDDAFSTEQAGEFAQHLIDVCTQPLAIGPIAIHPRVSIGLATPSSDTTTLSELLSQADRAMYRAKRTDSSMFEADEDLRREAELTFAIDRDLDRALEEDSIEFHYQPVRFLGSNELRGCESLIRWFHPDVGLVPPPLLIERAEATGRIDALTTWAIDRVARDLSKARELAPTFNDKQFSFNLSPRQFGWGDYVATHMSALDRNGLRPSDILIEVVESGTIEVETTAESTIRSLAAQGVFITLDDYGTGYNVISYFSRFPIHGIKIDRSMINSMVENPTMRTIVKGLTQMANELDIMVLGEGIETQAEYDECAKFGITLGQGYFLGRPMSLDALVELAHLEFPNQFPGAQAA